MYAQIKTHVPSVPLFRSLVRLYIFFNRGTDMNQIGRQFSGPREPVVLILSMVLPSQPGYNSCPSSLHEFDSQIRSPIFCLPSNFLRNAVRYQLN